MQYFKEKEIPVLGIEPSSSTAKIAIKNGIPTIEKFFGITLAEELVKLGTKADLLIGNNVLAHVPNVNDFVKGLEKILGNKGVLTMEFPHLKNIAINAAIDSGNGAAGVVIPKLIERMGWENTTLLCQDVDGNFPNHEADPTNISNMNCVINALRNNPTLEFGLGLDGDADRMNPITKTELLIPGDELLALYSQQVIKNNPHAAVVFDIKSSLSLIEELKRLGAKACIAPSGHSYIKEAMLNKIRDL